MARDEYAYVSVISRYDSRTRAGTWRKKEVNRGDEAEAKLYLPNCAFSREPGLASCLVSFVRIGRSSFLSWIVSVGN